MLLHISGWESSQTFPDLATLFIKALQLVAGGVMLLFAFLIAIALSALLTVRSFMKRGSLQPALRTLLRAMAFTAGLMISLVFVVLSAVFFPIGFLKTAALALALLLLSAFVIRRLTVLLLLRKFGRFLFLIRGAQTAGRIIFGRRWL